jgi:L,D-transpeptidase YcbB
VSLARQLLRTFAFMAAMATVSSPVLADAPLSPLRQRLEQAVGTAPFVIGGRAIDPTPLITFYQARDYRPAWLIPGQDAAAPLLAALPASAEAAGLPGAAYVVGPTDNDTDREILISATIERFGHDIAVGKEAPLHMFGGAGTGTRPPFDAVDFLNRAAAGTPLADLERQAQPPEPGYAALLGALARYTALARAGGWPVVPDGPTIKPGQEDPRVPTLRARLIASGDLDAAQAAKGTRFDPPLSAALRRYQERMGLDMDGALGKRTLATLDISVAERIRQIAANLERWRWQPRAGDALHIDVNIPAEMLTVVENGAPVMTMRVVVGDPKHPTPGMSTVMTSIVLNPTWTIPPSIAAKEILPKLKHDPNYLADNNMYILGTPPGGNAMGGGVDWSQYDGSDFPYRLRQMAGPDNALGKIKFHLEESDAIYLHDTPRHAAFRRSERALSHGCVRLEKPVELAEFLLGAPWTSKIASTLSTDPDTHTLRLRQPIPVHLQYWTAWADPDGTMHFRDDLYGHDARLGAALRRVPVDAPGQVAQDGAKHPL